jgi:hypothetical protein
MAVRAPLARSAVTPRAGPMRLRGVARSTPNRCASALAEAACWAAKVATASRSGSARRRLSRSRASRPSQILACATARTRISWAAASSQAGGRAPTIAVQMRASAASSSAGGAGRSPGRAGGTTASDTLDLRPRAIRTLPCDTRCQYTLCGRRLASGKRAD